MKLSFLSIAWTYLTRGADGIVDGVRAIFNSAMASLQPGNKARTMAVLNTVMKCLAVLKAVAFLIPAKWQAAYAETVQGLEIVVNALMNLDLSAEELADIRASASRVWAAWTSEDDETCVALPFKGV